MAEVQGIYAGLVMVESKCIEVDNSQSSQTDLAKLNSDQWQALIALQRTLLHEHHDFFLASQHPSASPALWRLAAKYAMPARMWRHGIHSFLELLRHRLPTSLDHMLTFIYMAYSMVALLYETVPAFEDTWIECLGDLGRYRMAIEDDDLRDREVWTSVSRHWYSQASDKAPSVGRLYHHLAILARPDLLQELHFLSESIGIGTRPARESIMTLFDPIMPPGSNPPAQFSPPETSFAKRHGDILRAQPGGVLPSGKHPSMSTTRSPFPDLDVQELFLHDPELCHDVDFDPELLHVPNLGGANGVRKQRDLHWKAVIDQFALSHKGFPNGAMRTVGRPCRSLLWLLSALAMPALVAAANPPIPYHSAKTLALGASTLASLVTNRVAAHVNDPGTKVELYISSFACTAALLVGYTLWLLRRRNRQDFVVGIVGSCLLLVWGFWRPSAASPGEEGGHEDASRRLDTAALIALAAVLSGILNAEKTVLSWICSQGQADGEEEEEGIPLRGFYDEENPHPNMTRALAAPPGAVNNNNAGFAVLTVTRFANLLALLGASP